MESAELKAGRENLQAARMSNGLQLPKEQVWLDNVIRSFIEAIKAQWREGMDEQVARARSNWLLGQINIRQWPHRYKIDGHPEIGEIFYRNQVASLTMLDFSVPMEVKVKYWQWLDDILLKGIQNQERELYRSIVQRVQELIYSTSDLRAHGESNAG